MSWIGRFFLKQQDKKVEQPKEETKKDDGILKGEIVGGTMTPVITPTQKLSTHILSPKKLNNRLSIITQHIASLEKRGASAETLAHWRERKEKVKAMLWIYYDQTD